MAKRIRDYDDEDRKRRSERATDSNMQSDASYDYDAHRTLGMRLDEAHEMMCDDDIPDELPPEVTGGRNRARRDFWNQM